MHSYSHSGLTIASEIELPEWAHFAVDRADNPDVEIGLGDGRSPPFPADGSTFVSGDVAGFRIAGVGGWEIEAGRRMTLYPSLAADPAELRLFTLGSAWGLLGYQRGQAMWHGSAVEIGGRSVLFCGDAGEGKSTMAAAMVAAGASLLGDDLGRVEPQERAALVHPYSARLKLWGEAVDHFDWRDRVIQRDVMRNDKFHCLVPRHKAGEAATPLAAVIVLARGEEPALERLEGSDALAQVMRATIYRPEALEAMKRWGEQGALAARIVSMTPAFKLTRPRELGALDRSVELVWRMLDRLG